MGKWLNVLMMLCISFFSAQFVYAQVEIKVRDTNRNYVAVDTLVITIDSNFQRFPTFQNVKYNLYNYSTTDTVYFDFEFDWFCSNSNLSAQICEHFYDNRGVCHIFHQEGKVLYDKHNRRKVYPDANNNDNFMAFDINIRYFDIEYKYEKYGKITVFKTNTNIVLDSLYLVVRRGTLPCNIPQRLDTSSDTTGMSVHNIKIDDIDIYPNPAHDYISIRSDSKGLQSYFLYAINGSIIKSGNVADLADNKLKISDVSDGMYFLKITDRKKNAYIRKLVIQH